MTLSENRWESFQILLDGDPGKVLHPPAPNSFKGTTVVGPDGAMRFDCWTIDATIYKGEEHEPADAPEEGILVAGTGQKLLTMVDVGAEDFGEAGDLYEVKLHVSGKWRMVTWEKMEKDKNMRPSPSIATSQYHICCSWHNWNFEEMTSVGNDTYTAEVHLLTAGGQFVIVRNADWLQVFHPFGESVLGPDSHVATDGACWSIQGSVGDVYKVTFQRSFGPDGEHVEVVWDFVRNTAPDPAALLFVKQQRFQVVFVNNLRLWIDSWPMNWTGKSHQLYVELTSGIAQFVIQRDGPWSTFSPVQDGESPVSSSKVEGPGEPNNKFWTLGDPENMDRHARYEISVKLSESGYIASIDCIPVRSGTPLEDAFVKGYFAIV